MSLRILALVTDAYGAGGGIAQYNRDLLAALSASDNVGEVIVLPRNGQADNPALPAKIKQAAAVPGKVGFALKALKATISNKNFDIIFCGHLYMAPLAALVAKLTGARLWLQIHGIEAWQKPTHVQRWAAEQAQLVTAVSRHTRRLFLAWANCKPEAVKVLPNTVEERFSPGLKSEALLDRHQLRGRKVLLTVSRLSTSERYKGHDRVIQAVAELKASYPEIVYVVAGDGDDMPRLKQLADELGVAAQVRFIGYVPDEELPDLYRAADVFVMPSTGEGFGIVFLQALASGIPVIGGDSDGSRDPLRDGHNGRLTSVDETTTLAGTIDEIIRANKQPHVLNSVFARVHFQALVSHMINSPFCGLSNHPTN
jgi:phosphatidylinositol alpha-1,6-mannosyltransferase